jgi:DNA topoisomerase I
MLEFARSLPAIRNTIASHMALRGLPRDKVFATVVHLLETTLTRVGNNDYVKQNKSYGFTTLRGEHVKVDGSELRFQFKGKTGKTRSLRMSDRRVAKIVRACQELPGQELFQYLDESGETRNRACGCPARQYGRNLPEVLCSPEILNAYTERTLALQIRDEQSGETRAVPVA